MVLFNEVSLSLSQVASLRYGDNKHQEGYGVYASRGLPNQTRDPFSFDTFEQIEGVALSKTNLLDIAYGVLVLRKMATCFTRNKIQPGAMSVGLKHANPCGASVGKDSVESIEGTVKGDSVNLFGGTVVTNFTIGKREAEILSSHLAYGGVRRLLDVIVAPAITDDARRILGRKGGACKMLINPHLASSQLATLETGVVATSVLGHLILEEASSFVLDFSCGYLKWEQYESSLPKRVWSSEAKSDLILAWAVGSSSWSNTITLVKGGSLVANGVGQSSRVDSVRVSLMKAGTCALGSLAYSDSFFPFEDGPQLLVDGGITHVFTSSGSVRDEQVFRVFRENRIALCSGPDAQVRGFRH